MAVTVIPQLSSSINADTNANPNTLVQRDGSAGIYGKIINGTSLQTTGTLVGSVSAQSASFTAGSATHYLVDCTSAAVAVTLPLASANAGVVYVFVKTDSVTGHALTFATVSGVASITAQYGKATIFSDGSTWWSV